MDNFKSSYTDFLSSMIEDTLYDLNLENTEYRKCRENERNNVEIIEAILNKLPAEDKEFMEEHEMDIFHISVFEQSQLYKQGYIDCVKLLKILGVI